jgi:hypothetical protein
MRRDAEKIRNKLAPITASSVVHLFRLGVRDNPTPAY